MSPASELLVIDPTKRGALKRLIAHLLIRLLIVMPLPAHVQAAAALFPVSMLWSLVGSSSQAEGERQAGVVNESIGSGNETVGSDRLISLTRSGERRYYHFDALGSVTALTDETGVTKGAYHLDAWGQFREGLTLNGGCDPDNPTGALCDAIVARNRFAFTGYQWEPDTDLYFAKARYYDPNTARFTTQDSYLGQPDNPPSLHRYLYANASPTFYVDPTGHASLVLLAEKEKERRSKLQGERGPTYGADQGGRIIIQDPSAPVNRPGQESIAERDARWERERQFQEQQKSNEAAVVVESPQSPLAAKRAMLEDACRGGNDPACASYVYGQLDAMGALGNVGRYGETAGKITLEGLAGSANDAKILLSGENVSGDRDSRFWAGVALALPLLSAVEIKAVRRALGLADDTPIDEVFDAASRRAGDVPGHGVNLLEPKRLQSPPPGVHFGPPRGGGGSAADRAYASRVTHGAEKSIYVNGTEFDSIRGGVLIDAKRASAAGSFYDISAADRFTRNVKIPEILAQANRQVKAVQGQGFRGIRWEVADANVAGQLRSLFRQQGLPITVVHTP